MDEPQKDPFSISYSSAVPRILQELKCTVAISTYSAGKVVILSSVDGEIVGQLPRHFKKPMGIAVADRRLAIATLRSVHTFANSPKLAPKYPLSPATYDGLYMPRATYYSGLLDLHDLDFGHDSLYAVNTGFSCLCKIDDEYSFRPYWQPHFISELLPQDRCHLNGMAMENGKPAYVTALSATDYPEGWREDIANSGIIMSVERNEILFEGLAMPHSPRLLGDKLYFLQSANGTVMCANLSSGSLQTIAEIPAFLRGLSIHGGYLFIGMSKIRKTSQSFKKLPLRDRANEAGFYILNAATGALEGQLIYETSVDEIYDVQVIPGMMRPGLVPHHNDVHEQSIAGPELNFWRKKKKKTEDETNAAQSPENAEHNDASN
ncbi:MAG: TIGR03032 family protein [Bacteroidota bacterium]